MKTIGSVILGVSCALALAACSSPQGESGTGAAPTAAGTGQASLTVVPGSVSACQPHSTVISRVSWDVKVPTVQQVRVMISDPGSSVSKLFSAGGPKGSEETGNWVEVGTRFDLLNAVDGTKLSTYVVTSEPCKNP